MLLTHLHSSPEESDQELASHSCQTPDLCESSSTPPTHESSCKNKTINTTWMNIDKKLMLLTSLHWFGVWALLTKCCLCCSSASALFRCSAPRSPGWRWCREQSCSLWQHGKECRELSWLKEEYITQTQTLKVKVRNTLTMINSKFWF